MAEEGNLSAEEVVTDRSVEETTVVQDLRGTKTLRCSLEICLSLLMNEKSSKYLAPRA